jgi:hypothetical protein
MRWVENVASMEQIRSAYSLRFDVFTVVKILIVVFWVVMLCGLVGGYKCFVGTNHLHMQREDGVNTSL